ncbi:MAG: N-acetyltransferase [Balneolaceae bacterium]
MKNISIRQEQRKDYDSVFEVIRKAFEDMEMTDHQEQFLVQRLRTSDAFVPELSLVAEHENEIIGHILLTNVRIKNGWQEFPSLALAPVTVLPGYQKQGIGGMLIKHAHKRAKELGFKSVILLGHSDYYPKFGYRKASEFGIQLPFDVPEEFCMALELTEKGLEGVSGLVEFPEEFNG